MAQTAAPPVAVSALTNSVISTEEWDVLFYEAVDPRPPTSDRATWVYGPERVTSKPDEGREKWLYVFLATLDAAGEVVRTSLQYEGAYDEGGALRLVDWSGGAGSWAGHDVRPPTVDRPGGRLRLSFQVDGSAVERASRATVPEGGRSVYLAFLSHVQLPAVRLDKYFGAWAHRHLLDRALLLDPSALTAAGESGGPAVGLGPTARDAQRGGGERWVQVVAGGGGRGPLAKAVLIDWVDFATELHAGYTAALNRLHAYDIRTAEKALHASITRKVVEAYEATERDEPGESVDVPGDPLAKVEIFEAERRPLVEDVRLWHDRLYGVHLETPAYALAREDATDFGVLDELSDETLDKIEAQGALHGDLLDGAERMEAGQRYLRQELVDSTRSWTRSVVFSPTLVRRLVQVPTKLYKDQVLSGALTEQKTAAETVEALRDQRVRMQTQHATAAQHAQAQRGVSKAAAAAVDRVQTDVLEALAATEANPLIVPGTPAFDEVAESVEAALRERAGRVLDAPFVPGRVEPGFRPVPVWEVVSPGGVWRPGAAVPAIEFSVMDPRVWRLPGQGVPDIRFRRFRFRRLDSGLLVLADGERTALANVRRLGLHGGPTPDALDARRKAIALERLRGDLLDAEVHATGAAADARAAGTAEAAAKADLDAVKARLAAGETTLNDASARAELRTTRVTVGGRLLFGLAAIGAAMSARTLDREIGAGRADRAAGVGHWEAYAAAYGAGASTAAGVMGTAESLELVSKRTLAAVQGRTALGRSLKAFGIAGGAMTIVAGGIALQQEHDSHDEIGQLSAVLVIASGTASVAGGTAFFFFPRATVLLRFLGWVGIAASLLSILFLVLSNTPIEDWFEGSIWGAEEDVPAGGDAVPSARITRELAGLFKIVAQPIVSVELWDKEGGDQLATYGSVSREAPDALRLVVRPGLLLPGWTIQVRDLRLRLPPIEGAWRELVPFVDGPERREETVARRLSVPDMSRDVYLPPSDGVAGAFVREFDLDDLAVSDEARMRLRMPPVGVMFACEVEVGPPTEGLPPELLARAPSVTMGLQGGVGYARTFDGPKLSVGLQAPSDG